MKKLRLAATGLLVSVSMLGAAGIANADPDAVAKAKADLERIQEEASMLDLEIIEAAVSAQAAEEELETINEELAEQIKLVESMSDDIGSIAVLQFQAGEFGLTEQLLTSEDDDDFLSSLATMQNETERSTADLQEYQLSQARVTELQREAEDTEEGMKEELATKKKLAGEYEAKEAEAQAVYDRLDAEEQERLRQLELEEQRQQDEEDRRASEAAEDSDDQESNNDGSANSNNESKSAASVSSASASGSASSRAMSAVSVAKAQVGKPYVWGTSGPGTFDCSGLMSYAYGQSGVSIPASSRAQAGIGTPVSKANLQPGDIVLYYHPVSHVGMYIGNGQIVHAANPRSGINITSVNSMPYAGARRPA